MRKLFLLGLIGSLLFADSATWSVGASSDDAFQTWGGTPPAQGGTVYLTFTAGTIEYTGWSPNRLGYRFTNVTIPAGSTITTAYIRHWLTSDDWSQHMDVAVRGELAANPGTFLESENNVSGRTRTTASVNWNAELTLNAWGNSPSLVSVIQEIVDQASWASGNAMVILYDAPQSSTNSCRAHFYDGAANIAEQLYVEWTPPSAPGGGAKRRRALFPIVQ